MAVRPQEQGENDNRWLCSFCALEREHVVAGQTPGLFICLDCVALCVEIFKESGVWPR